MMDELISRKAAIEVIDAVFPVDPMKSEYAQGIACGAALAKTYVEQLPSAQPDVEKMQDLEQAELEKAFELGREDAKQEVIRCKDCNQWYMGADAGSACKYTNMYQPSDGFCNWAERRTDESNV